MNEFIDDAEHNERRDTVKPQALGLRQELLSQLWSYARAYPKDLWAIAFFAVTTAAAEVSFPLLTKAIIDAVAQNSDSAVLYHYGVLLALSSILLAASIHGFIRIGGKLDNAISHDIRRDGFARLQTLSFSYFNKKPVGWLMARMTADCERLSRILVWGFLDLVWGATMIVGVTLAMLWMDAFLAVVVLTVMPPLALVSVYFQRKLLATARKATAINSQITASYNEAITGVITSKVFVREEANESEFRDLTHRLASVKVKNMTYSAIYLPVVVTLASLSIGITLVLGGIDVLAGTITVGTLIAFMRFAHNIFEPIEEISQRFAELQMAQASAERIFDLINEQPEIQDAEKLSVDVNDTSQIDNISLNDVCFSYDSREPILTNINLTITQGQSVALVGPTGGGKSTLANLIARFYEPTSGSVNINGRDYREYPQFWLHSRLGVILQDNHLFSGTLMDNIRYGRLDASDDEVINASRVAGAHQFINSLDEGYATEAGERGNRLSAGQKQLVAFARALLADPQLLIMDEATSAIDTETEQHIQRGMRSLLDKRISLIIAHRLSTIKEADQILYIEAGEIVERGTHQQLLNLNGRYRKLYETQQIENRTGELYAESDL